MNVLDIDLDFFLDGSVGHRSDDVNNRPDEFNLVPWADDAVADFLRNNLHAGEKNAGAVVQSHHEVFYEWKTLIEKDELSVPFKVVHVDAHSDLGLGSLSFTYLHSQFLSLDVNDRPNARQGDDGVNFGSFLAFALGCRWISELDFVVNRNWHDDLPRALLSEESLQTVEQRSPLSVLPYADYNLEIELMQTPEWDYTSSWDTLDVRKPIGEPRIPFNIITIESLGDRYSETSWDYVFLSHSPGYVPSYADHLLKVIGRFITERP